MAPERQSLLGSLLETQITRVVSKAPAGVVPVLNTQAVKAAPLIGLNDEVAAILNGLQLNKQWFQERIRPEQKLQLLPQSTQEMGSSLKLPGGQMESSRSNGRPSQRPSQRPGALSRRPKPQQVSKTADFDIYLNEAVMPVLAQSLDALCRQMARMKEQGDQLDPKVRARFNPLTWLAQQLLRRHPKCARTPRRQLLYRGFKDWADIEKGRRELLRRRNKIEEAFNGFSLRGVVVHDRIDLVLQDVDESLHLQGLLKNSSELRELLNEAKRQPAIKRNLTVPATASRRGSVMFEGKTWSFDEFWFHFANAVWKCEAVPYSAILRGEERQKQVDKEKLEFEERQAAADAEKEQMETEKRLLGDKYNVLYERLCADAIISEISNGDKILSGDDVRPGDVGYEFEAPPHGPHVALLSELMSLLGLDVSRPEVDELAQDSQQSQPQVGDIKTGFFRQSAKSNKIEGCDDDEEYWDERLSRGWSVVQRAHHAEADDGVVDGEVLKQVLVPPVGFDMLRAKVEYEIEQRSTDFELEAGPSQDLGANVGMEKPSMEQLCLRLGMTMSRLEWLHALFETFLQPEDPNDPDAPLPCCLYPDCPASINKEQMRCLVSEVEPGLSKAQFEARFKRLDQDGSGMIEFDEFTYWVHSSGVRVTGTHQVKMTLQELANRYQEQVALIKYLHGCFQDQFPEEITDGYPKTPVGLTKEDAKVLAQILTPGLDLKDFDENFELVDGTSRQKGHCDFDEFLEILILDDLPAELRDRFDDGENATSSRSGLSDVYEEN